MCPPWIFSWNGVEPENMRKVESASPLILIDKPTLPQRLMREQTSFLFYSILWGKHGPSVQALPAFTHSTGTTTLFESPLTTDTLTLSLAVPPSLSFPPPFSFFLFSFVQLGRVVRVNADEVSGWSSDESREAVSASCINRISCWSTEKASSSAVRLLQKNRICQAL